MIGSVSTIHPGGGTEGRKSGRRVTFLAGPQPSNSTAPSLYLPRKSSYFNPLSGHGPAARPSVVPLSQHLDMVTLGIGPRNSTGTPSSQERYYPVKTAASGGRLSTRPSSVRTLSVEARRHSPKIPSAAARQVLSTRTPPSADGGSARAQLPPGRPRHQQRLQRPRTTTPTQFRSRRLGAELYPTLQRGDVDREKAFFRSGVFLINRLFRDSARSQSSRWRAMGSRVDSSPGGDSFCRASRAEASMNNAHLAKVYHVVPQRVVSARSGRTQDMNVALQQLNQSPCHRRDLSSWTITNTTNNDDQTAVGDKVSKKGAREGSLDKDRGESPDGVSVQALRGMDVQEHSAEWVEETRLKHEDSVAILSEQLESMLPQRQEELSLYLRPDKKSSRGQVSLPGRPPVSSSNSVSLLPDSESQVDEGGEEEPGELDGRKLCMKTMQCEVLGPYSCTDCTKIRLHEQQHDQQTALYPGLAVDPRTLVAPDRLRRLTASLPSQLTSHRHTLDCGCSIRLHPDFLFPVIVTDHDIHTRLRALRSAPAQRQIESSSSQSGAGASLPVTGSVASAEGREKEEKKEKPILDAGEDGAEEVSMSPTDMKVTVRYNTPSPEQKGSVFLTN